MEQAATQSQAPTVATPSPATTVSGAPATPRVVTGESGVTFKVPTNRAEVRVLQSQRSELSDQLISAANRREELANELAKSADASRPGIQNRIDLLDQRILQIEADIATSGRLLVSAQGTGQEDPSPFNFPGDLNVDFTAVSVVLILFVVMPLAVTMARNMWRRGGSAPKDSQLERQNAERLARLETSVDAIAVEMERVSEGQRFVTKLLAESKDRLKVEAPRN